jgi:hypothetical protein
MDGRCNRKRASRPRGLTSAWPAESHATNTSRDVQPPKSGFIEFRFRQS